MQVCARSSQQQIIRTITTPKATIAKTIHPSFSLVSVFLTSQVYITHNYSTLSPYPGGNLSHPKCSILGSEVPHHEGAIGLAHSHQTSKLVTSSGECAKHSTTGMHTQRSGSAGVVLRRSAAQRVSARKKKTKKWKLR